LPRAAIAVATTDAIWDMTDAVGSDGRRFVLLSYSYDTDKLDRDGLRPNRRYSTVML